MHAGVCKRDRDYLGKCFDLNIFVLDVILENMAKRAHNAHETHRKNRVKKEQTHTYIACSKELQSKKKHKK